MQPQYIKIDSNTLGIVEQIVVKPATSTYVYDDLVANVNTLQQQKKNFVADIDQKIATAQDLVTQADQLGIVPLGG